MQEEFVIALLKTGGVFALTPSDFEGRRMTISEVVAIFGAFDAFWQYEGDPCATKPHALLKSGLHSNGFIVCKDFLKYPKICELFAHEMLKKLIEKLAAKDFERIGVVASSAYSAINLGWEIARLLSAKGLKGMEYVPVEKDEKGNPTIIRGGIDSAKIVLVINELMTTGTGSTWETKRAVLNCNGNNPPPTILDPALVLVHRSKDWTLGDGSNVAPVFHFDIENFKPEECPYCKAGSEAIKPKIGDNWQRLHHNTGLIS